MDTVQKQVSTLTHKVDVLYQMIERLNYKVSEALSEKQSVVDVGSERSLRSPGKLKQFAHHNSNRLQSVMEHKDVLVDNNSFNRSHHSSSEKELSPEIQIQRLTAQLTAAYNRIAALEEQLLASRFH